MLFLTFHLGILWTTRNSLKCKLVYKLILMGYSQVPRPSCEEGRENEGPKTGEFSFHDRLWQKFSLKVENSAHNWNRQHVNSLLFIDEPGISPLGVAVQLLFSLPPVWAFPSSHLGIPISAFFNWISFVFVPLFVFLFSD